MSKPGENISKRKDGRWEARFVRGRGENGKPLYGYVYGKSYREAKEKKFYAMKENAFPKDEDTLFSAALDMFLAKKKNSVKDSTYSHYCEVVEIHIRPKLGNLPIRNITGQTVEEFADEKLRHGRIDGRGGLASKNVRDMLSIIKMSLDIAQSNKMIENKVSFSRPRLVQKNIEILDADEQEAIFTLSASDDTRRFGIFLCLQTGLRIGEICALKWEDIDFEREVIIVGRTVLRIKNTEDDEDNIIKGRTRLVFDTPKTKTSARIIPLPHSLVQRLHEIRCGARDSDFFLTASNICIEPRLYSYFYKKILREKGIKDYGFHALRHTFATRCIEKGFDAKSLSEILGHSNVKITLERYVHPSLALKKELMQKLSEVF